MPASPLLNGVLPVLQTPLQADGSIDVPTLEREIDWAFQAGADGVVIAMVSEILRLGYHGRKALAAHVCSAVQGRGFTVISVGAESVREALDFARHAEGLGASGHGDSAGLNCIGKIANDRVLRSDRPRDFDPARRAGCFELRRRRD